MKKEAEMERLRDILSPGLYLIACCFCCSGAHTNDTELLALLHALHLVCQQCTVGRNSMFPAKLCLVMHSITTSCSVAPCPFLYSTTGPQVCPSLSSGSYRRLPPYAVDPKEPISSDALKIYCYHDKVIFIQTSCYSDSPYF